MSGIEFTTFCMPNRCSSTEPQLLPSCERTRGDSPTPLISISIFGFDLLTASLIPASQRAGADEQIQREDFWFILDLKGGRTLCLPSSLLVYSLKDTSNKANLKSGFPRNRYITAICLYIMYILPQYILHLCTFKRLGRTGGFFCFLVAKYF